MEATASYVAECMRFYYQVQEIAVPDKAARARCAIMASENWQTASQLMVLVPNHLNGCPLGLWSRSLCIDQGLRFGTMLPYVDTAYREGFAVIICNPAATTAPYTDEKGVVQKVRATTTTRPLLLFHMAISLCCASQTTHPQPHRPPPPPDAHRGRGDARGARGVGVRPPADAGAGRPHRAGRVRPRRAALQGDAPPLPHGARCLPACLPACLFDPLDCPRTTPRPRPLLAHPDHRDRSIDPSPPLPALPPQFEHPTVAAKPIATLALMEACRLREPGESESPEVAASLAARAVNLKKSQHPIGRALPDVAAAIGVGSCFSLGTAGPDTNPAWSIYQGMGEVFKFCQRRASSEKKAKAPRLKLKGLGLLGSLGRGRGGAGAGKQPVAAGSSASVASSASSVDGSTVMPPGAGGSRGGVGGGSTASSVASGGGGGPITAGARSSAATSCSYTSGPFPATESVDQVRGRGCCCCCCCCCCWSGWHPSLFLPPAFQKQNNNNNNNRRTRARRRWRTCRPSTGGCGGRTRGPPCSTGRSA